MKTPHHRSSSRVEIRHAPDASLPGHMQHLRKPRPVGQRQRAEVASQPTARKRGGAKFGPPPRELPPERMQAPAPMRSMVREQIYLAGRGLGGLTPRQHRQYCRMALRHGDGNVFRGLGKGRPTPKRASR